MSEVVIDVLLIKTIEKEIGRKLDPIDIEAVYYGEPLFFQDPGGTWHSYFVPLYRMPHDLMPKEVDMFLIESSQFNPNPWNGAHDLIATTSKQEVANTIKAGYEDQG